METRNLWGESFKPEPIRTPSIILREQASLVGKLTEYMLDANVDRDRTNDYIRLDLSINAPALENYTYNVLSVTYDIHKIYPLTIRNQQTYKSQECSNEEEFVEALHSILSSDQVKKVIVNLLSQIKAES